MPHSKKHRTALYTLVVILAIMQVISFVIISGQVTKLNANLDSEIKQTSDELKEYSEGIMETYDTLYQENFNELSGILAEHEETFGEQIKFLKSSQGDFSGVVQDAIKGVVRVSTEDSIGSGFIILSCLLQTLRLGYQLSTLVGNLFNE